MTRLRTWTFVALAASSLGLAACGSSSSSSTTTTAASTATTGSSTTPSTYATDLRPVAPPARSGTEPTITVPPGSPPTQLETKDLIVGTGPAAKAGDTVTVQYVGVAYSSKQIFDSSWSRSQPFSFVLGKGTVIPGWDRGRRRHAGRGTP